MLRLLLLAIAVTAAKASYLSYADGHGLQLEPKLISQSVGPHEVPVKVIRITKTVAIRVPVPYPVKVPHHIPVPVPVNHPIAVPIPQIVKVPHHVPVEVPKPVAVELPQQVPLVVPRPVLIRQPIRVPHPVHIDRPIYYPVPHAIPFPNFGNDHQASSYGSDDSLNTHESGGPAGYDSDDHDAAGYQSRSYSYYTVDSPQGSSQSSSYGSSSENFEPSQPDYSADNEH